MKKYLALLLAALLFMLTGCAGNKETEKTAEESGFTLTIATLTAIETATRGEYNYDMLASGTSEPPLVWQDPEGNYHPLTASFETEDAKTWTYTVTEGMTWEDGEPVTAEDILFTLLYEEQEGSAVFQSQTDAEGNVTEAKYEGYTLSEDKQSISLTLREPNVRELSNMTSFRVMPKHIYEGKTEVTEAEARIGCGPYKLESWSPESGTLVYTRNEYYPGRGAADRVVYRVFGNDDTMYMALQNGDADMVWNYSAGVPAVYAEVLAGSESVRLLSVAASNAPAVLAFNNEKGLFADENLRKAVSCALDYEQFRTYFGSEYSELPGKGFVPPATLGYTETEALSNDPDMADELMTAAGFGEKNSDGYYVNESGEEAAFTLTYNTAKETNVSCAELVKTQLESFGIRVTLDGCDKDSYNAKTSNKFSGNNVTMEAAIYSYTSAGMGMGDGLGSIYVDGSHPVQGGCQVFDTAFKEALEALRAAGSMEEYCEAAKTVQGYYADHTPLIALYWDNMVLACGAGLQGLTADAALGLNSVPNILSITK